MYWLSWWMVACYLLRPWVRWTVRETELKSKGLYFRLLCLLWVSHGVDSLPICFWTRNILFNKREDWGFYLAQPFPSWFPNFLPLQQSRYDPSRPAMGAKQGEGNHSVIAHPWWIWTSTIHAQLLEVPSPYWQLNVLVCKCWCASWCATWELRGRLKSCVCF